MDLQHLRASDGTGEAVLAHVQTVRNPGSTVLDLDNVDNWNGKAIIVTGTPAANGFVSPVGMKVMYGHLSAGDFIIDGYAPGYVDNGNTTAEVAIVKMTTSWADALVDILKQTLADNGKIKTDGIDSETMFADNVDPVLRTGEMFSNHINVGGIWTLLSGLNAGMTALTAYITGYRNTLAAVATRAFTASKDTYVDLLRTGGTFSLVYTEVANGAASPALAANSVRVAKVVTSGAAITSITQQGLDSLLNLIYPAGPVQSDDLDITTWHDYVTASPTITPSIVSNASVTLPVQSKMHKYLCLFSAEIQNGGGGAAEYFAIIQQAGSDRARLYWNAVAGDYLNSITPQCIIYSKTAEVINFGSGRTVGSAGAVTNRAKYTVIDLGVA